MKELLISFEIVSEDSRKVFLLVGSDDECFVELRHIPIFGHIGRREFNAGEDIVELSLIPGRNFISILCRKLDTITDWYFDASLSSTYDRALDYHVSHNFHLLATPIVESARDLRLLGAGMHGLPLSICTLDGTESWQVVANTCGEISISAEFPSAPFIGFLRAGDKLSEPFIVLGSSSIIDGVHKVVGDDVLPGGVWNIRLKILLDSLSDGSDCWTSRKIVLSVIKILESTRGRVIDNGTFNCYKLRRLDFDKFRSTLDDTEQSSLFYRSKTSGTDGRMIVVAPPVPVRVRPFLESSVLANLKDIEEICAVADICDVSVLWPGIVDVDYGGALARFELKESIQMLVEHLGMEHPKVALMGTCSSGVLALGFAEDFEVSALLLETPMISRHSGRWLMGTPAAPVAYPDAAAAYDSPLEGLDRIRDVPVYLDYNDNMPGHGDPILSSWLVKYLDKIGADLKVCWPEGSTAYLWGEGLRSQIEPMFEWLNERWERARIFSAGEILVRRRSIKELLISGFRVEPIDDPTLRGFIGNWRELWATYRGSAFSMSQKEGRKVRSVSSVVYSNSRNLEPLSPHFFIGSEIYHSREMAEGDRVLFGFRIVRQGGLDNVQIFRNHGTENFELPVVDLLVDGNCSGALWERVYGEWVLIQVWI